MAEESTFFAKCISAAAVETGLCDFKLAGQ